MIVHLPEDTALFFFFNDTAPTEIYTLSLHAALPISPAAGGPGGPARCPAADRGGDPPRPRPGRDRKSTRLNSSHSQISYAVFCLTKNHTIPIPITATTLSFH